MSITGRFRAATARVTGAAIIAAARRGIGAPYVWGGNGPARLGWDCSGFVTWVLRSLGLAVPPGRPVVQSYAQWDGAVTVTDPQPGDLVIWWHPGIAFGGHIGFYEGPNKMVSALDTQSGTIESPIIGIDPSGSPVYRRLRGITGVPAGPLPRPGQGLKLPVLALAVAAAAVLGLVLVTGLAAAGGAVTRAARP